MSARFKCGESGEPIHLILGSLCFCLTMTGELIIRSGRNLLWGWGNMARNSQVMLEKHQGGRPACELRQNTQSVQETELFPETVAAINIKSCHLWAVPDPCARDNPDKRHYLSHLQMLTFNKLYTFTLRSQHFPHATIPSSITYISKLLSLTHKHTYTLLHTHSFLVGIAKFWWNRYGSYMNNKILHRTLYIFLSSNRLLYIFLDILL